MNTEGENAILVRALVFDLAGVLLDFRGVESVHEMSGGQTSPSAFARFWAHSAAADQLYRGELSPTAFARAAVEELSLAVGPIEFLSEFEAWLHGPYAGAFELLDALRSQVTIVCLSNTNELDVARFRNEFALHERFHHCFFSNEIGFRKPEPAAYEHILRILQLSPAEVAFFDDDPICVAGAEAVGLRAFQCLGLCSAIDEVRRLGFLDSPPEAGSSVAAD